MGRKNNKHYCFCHYICGHCISNFFAGKALTKLADFAALGVLNKLLGGIFGGLKIALILSILLLIFNTLNKTIPFVSDEEIETSILYNPVKSLAPMIFPNFINEDTPLELPTSQHLQTPHLTLNQTKRALQHRLHNSHKYELLE